MKSQRLVLSISLGALLTVGLLVGFQLNPIRTIGRTQASEPATAEREAGPSRAQSTVNTAHIIVRFADNDNIVRDITFTTPITSYRALELAGLDPVGYVHPTYGQMLCGINGVGEVSDDGTSCDNGTRYWGTFDWAGGAWEPDMGVGSEITKDGHVDGFSWSHPNWAMVDPPPAPPLVAAQDAIDWLQAQRRADGGFGTINDSVEVLLAISSNNLKAATWYNKPSLLGNVLSLGPEFANRNPAGAGKLAAALAADHACWPIGAREPLDYYEDGEAFDDDTLYQAWGILGTAALSQSVPAAATEALQAAQHPSGGWEWAVGAGADTNSTALVIQALVGAGVPVTSTTIHDGLSYLEHSCNPDGGIPFAPGSPSDVNSTAYAIQAIRAVGEDPMTGTWAISNTNPVEFLLDQQLPDGRFKGYASDQLATQQVIPALLYRPWPVRVNELNGCYGIIGEVATTVGPTATPLESVSVMAASASDLFFATTDAGGTYTISVPSTGVYTLTPSKDRFTFTPSEQTVAVGGSPGDITSVSSFGAETRVYLPLALRSSLR